MQKATFPVAFCFTIYLLYVNNVLSSSRKSEVLNMLEPIDAEKLGWKYSVDLAGWYLRIGKKRPGQICLISRYDMLQGSRIIILREGPAGSKVKELASVRSESVDSGKQKVVDLYLSMCEEKRRLPRLSLPRAREALLCPTSA
jgi:hypothetical protein